MLSGRSNIICLALPQTRHPGQDTKKNKKAWECPVEELCNPCLTPPFCEDLAACQRVFSFPCLVVNRCSRTNLLGRQLHGKVWEAGSITEFMIQAIREASGNKMATVLCQYQCSAQFPFILTWCEGCCPAFKEKNAQSVSPLRTQDCCCDYCPSAELQQCFHVLPFIQHDSKCLGQAATQLHQSSCHISFGRNLSEVWAIFWAVFCHLIFR